MKKVCFFSFCLFLSFVFAVNILAQDATKSFRKHYIIIVDQGACQSHENLPKLYEDLKLLFETDSISIDKLSKESFEKDFDFDPLHDEVSIFASGISESEYSQILNNCMSGSISADSLNDKVVKFMFKPVKSFQNARIDKEIDIAAYFDFYLKPLMTNNRSGIRVGLNEFIYPLILGRLNVTVPSESYYIIRVSNFTSQGGAKSIKEMQLKPMVAKRPKFIDGFDQYCTSIQSPFFLIPHLKIVYDTKNAFDAGNYKYVNDNPVVLGDKLELATLVGVGLSGMSFPHFKQKKYGKNKFNYSAASIHFPHDNHIAIKHVYWDLLGRKEDKTSEYSYNAKTSEYEFPAGETNIDSAFAGKVIDMNYIFDTQSYDDNGKPLFPMIFKSTCQYQLTSDDFAPAPNRVLNIILSVLGIILFLALLVYELLRIWKNRGLNRKAWVEFVIRPVSRSRFMEVKDKKVVNEDCWYMGPDNQNQRITIEGDLKKEDLSFGKEYYYRLEYCVVDEDSEYDFTFRPDGQDAQGKNLLRDNWYRVDVDEDDHFRLNMVTYLDLEHSPHLAEPENLKNLFADSEHPYRLLRMRIKFRILIMNKKERRFNIKAIQLPDTGHPERYCVQERLIPLPGYQDKRFERAYDFMVKPDFERKTAWVAFDPGTTGSCVAFAFGGSPWEPITLAKNQYTTTEGKSKETTCIFPSVIKVQDRARCFRQEESVVTNVEQWKLDTDFIFGNKANQRLGNNRFKSIKKLLGYTTLLNLKKDDIIRQISGKDLASLLVRGLYKEVSDFAMAHEDVDDNLRKNMSDENGQFAPTRAIVAVPNNYTLLKIQDMVDSVKRLGCFKEVHYLYESEGVMMNYLNKMWTKLSTDDNNKVFLVYDMGGATINATAFKLDVSFDDQRNIERLTVSTIAKVGYCVGGDDIDYALIRILFGIPAVTSLLGNDDNRINELMNQNKQKLIQFVTDLKLDLIDTARKTTSQLRYLANKESFINAVCNIMKGCGIQLDPRLFGDGEEDYEYIKKELGAQVNKSSLMYKFVYSKVEDAIKELMKDLDAGTVEVIFSGRSSLYPHIQDYVKDTMTAQGFMPNVWNGFNDSNGYLDADAVKTAVAAGACWYAVFNTMIRLDHSVIPSTFGYIDQEGNKPKFIPVIKRLDKYVDGKKTCSVKPKDSRLPKITFLQMLGSDYDKILDDFYQKKINRHKINLLDEIPGEIIDGSLENITITIEDNNNFEYDVQTSIKHITTKDNRYSRIIGHEDTVVKTEIVDENNESYVFAALQSVDEKFEEGRANRL